MPLDFQKYSFVASVALKITPNVLQLAEVAD